MAAELMSGCGLPAVANLGDVQLHSPKSEKRAS